MRGTFSIGNLFAEKDMTSNHPIKIGYEDKTADFIHDKVVLGILAFFSTIFLSLIFGVFSAIIVVLIAGLSYYLKFETGKGKGIGNSKEAEKLASYYQINNLEDLSEIKEKNAEECNEVISNELDFSTEYTLFSL